MSSIRYGQGNHPRDNPKAPAGGSKPKNGVKYSQPGSLTGGGTTTMTGTGKSAPASTPAQGGQQASMMPNTSTPGGPVYTPPPGAASTQPPAAGPAGFGPNRVSAAPNSAKFYSSPAGEFVSGVQAAFSSNPSGTVGRDLASMPTAYQAGTLAGVIGQVYGASGLAGGAASIAESSVYQLNKVGTLGRAAKASSTAGSIAANPVAQAATRTWLSRLAQSSTNPAFVASTLVAAIGSYPFAGFIKEEALQTLGYATTGAIRNGDLEGAQAAIEMQREVLDPAVITGIMEKVPFVNVLATLKEFFDAAELKVSIDQRVIDDLRAKESSGETDDQYWARIYAARDSEREAARVADEQYYAQVAIRQAEAKAAARAEDEAYWARIMAEREESARRKRDAEEEFWSGYYKRVDSLRKPGELASSKLNFGLL